MDCLYYKKHVDDRECYIRHRIAVNKRVAQNPKYTASGFDPCFACPEIIELLESKGAKEVMSKQGTCKKCKRENIGLAAGGLCWKCYEAKKASPAGRKRRNEKVMPAEVPPAETPIVTRPTEKADPLPSLTKSVLLLNLDECPGLSDFLARLAKLELRTPEMQALWMLRNAINAVAEDGR
jgi:hypothetical protein